MIFFSILRVVSVSTFLFASVSGLCLNPKARKEWRSISTIERASWINATKCLADLPRDPKVATTVDPALSSIPPLNKNSSRFDDLSYIHTDLNILIHRTGYFLPWHRIFIQTFEDELRSKCGYTGVHPYWDWTKDTEDFYHASIFSNSTVDGLGSWGDPANDFQITTGGFKDIKVAYPVPHTIRRNFTLQPFLGVINPRPSAVNPGLMINTTFTKKVVDHAVSSFTEDFVSFQTYVESVSGPHSGVHFIVGGDMSGRCPFGLKPPNCIPGAKWAPSDPMFFLHHAMIDKVWYDWQSRDLSNKNAFGGGSVSKPPSQEMAYPTGAPPFLNLSSVIPGDGLWNNVTVQDVMDTTGNRLCYIYA